MKISDSQISLFTEDSSMSYPEGSPVSRTHQPGSERERMMTATSGLNSCEQFGRFNRSTSWAKMFAGSLIGTGGWFSTRCRLTWKMKASKFSRFYFQLRVVTPRTNAIVSSLLPTPVVMDSNQGDLEKIDQRRARAKSKGYNGNGFGETLGELANRKLLPTPKAVEIEEDFEAWKKRMNSSRHKKNHNKTHPNLGTMARSEMLPTPEASNAKNGTRSETSRIKRKKEQGWNIGLNDQATLGMLPTPTASMNTAQDFEQAKFHSSKRPVYSEIEPEKVDFSKSMLPTPRVSDTNDNHGGVEIGKHGGFFRKNSKRGANLSEAVKMLPTPAASNYKGGCTRTDPKRQNDTLAHALHGQHGQPGKTSQLNPLYVLEMMGFPPDWTLIPFLKESEEENPINHSDDGVSHP